MKVKFTSFEANEINYKIEVLIMSGHEMWDSIKMTKRELSELSDKIKVGIVKLSEKEFKIVKEETENLLDIAETNLDAGFPEYKNDVLKLRKLMKKLDGE